MRFVPFACIGILLAYTYRLFDSGYFGLDDFNNLYWAEKQSFVQMIGHVANPLSTFFRPTGMLCYWVLGRLFDLDPLPYHAFAWSIHAVNTALVYLILKRITKARAGSAVGAMLFSSQAVFADIYWNFGTIFELTSALLFFAGILFWMKDQRSLVRVVIAVFLLLLALKAKEMAITLPVIWLMCDLLLRSKREWKRLAWIALPAGIGSWYGAMRLAEMRGTTPDHPYYMQINSLTLGRGFGAYFNILFNLDLRWQLWSIGFVGLVLIFLILKNRQALFFQLYVFVTFLPLVFLVNHREPFYWYIPFFGLCGLAGLLVQVVVKTVELKVQGRPAVALASAAFVLLSWGTYHLQKKGSAPRREWQQEIAGEYRDLVAGLQAMAPPAPNETIFFDSMPRYFDSGTLLYAMQLALHRTDLNAKVVSQFPAEARYRLRFENSRLIQVSETPVRER